MTYADPATDPADTTRAKRCMCVTNRECANAPQSAAHGWQRTEKIFQLYGPGGHVGGTIGIPLIIPTNFPLPDGKTALYAADRDKWWLRLIFSCRQICEGIDKCQSFTVQEQDAADNNELRCMLLEEENCTVRTQLWILGRGRPYTTQEYIYFVIIFFQEQNHHRTVYHY